MTKLDYDVAIVGYGPVGQTAAALLGRAGHRVGVFERFGCLYDLPRAIHFDHEIMRVWQALGIVEEIADDLLPVREYRWFGADGEPIMTMRAETPAPSGWEPNYLFFQPYLERALGSRGAAQRVGRAGLERNRAGPASRPRGGAAATRPRRRAGPGHSDRRDANRACALRDRRRRREVDGQGGARNRLGGPRLRRKLAHARPATARHRRARASSDHVPVVRSEAAAHAHPQRAKPPALGVHAASRTSARRTSRIRRECGSSCPPGSARTTRS